MLPPSVIVIRVIGYKVIYNKKSRGGTLGTYRFDHGCPRWAPPPLVEMVEVITADGPTPPSLVERVEMEEVIAADGHHPRLVEVITADDPIPSGGNSGCHYS